MRSNLDWANGLMASCRSNCVRSSGGILRIARDLPPKNGSRPYVRTVRTVEPKLELGHDQCHGSEESYCCPESSSHAKGYARLGESILPDAAIQGARRSASSTCGLFLSLSALILEEGLQQLAGLFGQKTAADGDDVVGQAIVGESIDRTAGAGFGVVGAVDEVR